MILEAKPDLTQNVPLEKYAPTEGSVLTVPSNRCNSSRQIDLTPVHLPPCQMLRFPPVPLPGAPLR